MWFKIQLKYVHNLTKNFTHVVFIPSMRGYCHGVEGIGLCNFFSKGVLMTDMLLCSSLKTSVS